jgi:hypothetical protein
VRVTLLPELFEPPDQHTRLIALLRYPLDERHRIDLDTTHPAVAAWLAAQARELCEEIELALELSAQTEAMEPSHTAVEVVRAKPSDYLATPLRVSLHEAQRFLESPFVLLLEDEHSDRAFLERMMTGEERRFFERRMQAGDVRVDHGGGIESMTRRITREAAAPEVRHQRWVLFDSDAMRPRKPSAASETLRKACRDITHHQLRRRYVESYLPHKALHGWASGQPRRDVREERLERLRTFVALTDEQRHHYNMKRGFEGDAQRTDATAGDLYANVSQAARQVLAHGFGSDIAELFAGELVTEAELRRDTGWAELRPVITDLLARMR